MKRCKVCLIEKELDCFYLQDGYKNKVRVKVLMPLCKKCKNALNLKKYRVKNPVCKIVDYKGEVWRSLSEYNGFYDVSNLGRIRSNRIKNREQRLLKQHTNKKGYLCVSPKSISGKQRHIGVHRLVATAFIPNPENKPQVNHKNGIKTDNRVENLEWATNKENIIHAYKNNLIKVSKGESHRLSKLKDKDIVDIKRKYFGEQKTIRSIACEYDVYRSTIGRVISNKTWKHLIPKE